VSAIIPYKDIRMSRFKIPRVTVESEQGVHSLVLEKQTLWVLPENAVAQSASELLNTCLQIAYLAGAKETR
jgi:hypothetical protein